MMKNTLSEILYLIIPEESWNSYAWSTDRKRIPEGIKWFLWYIISFGAATGIATFLD